MKRVRQKIARRELILSLATAAGSAGGSYLGLKLLYGEKTDDCEEHLEELEFYSDDKRYTVEDVEKVDNGWEFQIDGKIKPGNGGIIARQNNGTFNEDYLLEGYETKYSEGKTYFIFPERQVQEILDGECESFAAND